MKIFGGYEMSIAVAYIPEGYSAEQKQQFIQGVKQACMDGFGVTEDHSFVSIHELMNDNMDVQTKRMKCLYVYTTYGKSLEGKNTICKGFHQVCMDIFGSDTDRTIVIFKEHTHENHGISGFILPLMPGFKDLIADEHH